MIERWWVSVVALTGLGMMAAPLEARDRDDVHGEPLPLGEAACGRPGLPDCPLQAWMKANIAAPKAAANAELLAKNLQRIAGLAPPGSGWSADWKVISDAGALAAKKSDKDGVNASCASCHAKYRKAYRERYRENPVPS